MNTVIAAEIGATSLVMILGYLTAQGGGNRSRRENEKFHHGKRIPFTQSQLPVLLRDLRLWSGPKWPLAVLRSSRATVAAFKGPSTCCIRVAIPQLGDQS